MGSGLRSEKIDLSPEKIDYSEENVETLNFETFKGLFTARKSATTGILFVFLVGGGYGCSTVIMSEHCYQSFLMPAFSIDIVLWSF
jgi:hypothetical protein